MVHAVFSVFQNVEKLPKEVLFCVLKPHFLQKNVKKGTNKLQHIIEFLKNGIGLLKKLSIDDPQMTLRLTLS